MEDLEAGAVADPPASRSGAERQATDERLRAADAAVANRRREIPDTTADALILKATA